MCCGNEDKYKVRVRLANEYFILERPGIDDVLYLRSAHATVTQRWSDFTPNRRQE